MTAPLTAILIILIVFLVVPVTLLSLAAIVAWLIYRQASGEWQ